MAEADGLAEALADGDAFEDGPDPEPLDPELLEPEPLEPEPVELESELPDEASSAADSAAVVSSVDSPSSTFTSVSTSTAGVVSATSVPASLGVQATIDTASVQAAASANAERHSAVVRWSRVLMKRCPSVIIRGKNVITQLARL